MFGSGGGARRLADVRGDEGEQGEAADHDQRSEASASLPVRLGDDLLDNDGGEDAAREGKKGGLEQLAWPADEPVPDGAPRKIGIANPAANMSRLARGTPASLNVAMAAKPSGMSAGT